MNTFTLTINGYRRVVNGTHGQIADVLSSYANYALTLRTQQYGEINPTLLADKLCAQPMYGGGRTVHIYNATICALGADFGTVTVS